MAAVNQVGLVAEQAAKVKEAFAGIHWPAYGYDFEKGTAKGKEAQPTSGRQEIMNDQSFEEIRWMMHPANQSAPPGVQNDKGASVWQQLHKNQIEKYAPLCGQQNLVNGMGLDLKGNRVANSTYNELWQQLGAVNMSAQGQTSKHGYPFFENGQ